MAQARSTATSPNSPVGRTSRNKSASTYGNQPSMPPFKSAPTYTSASFSVAPTSSPATIVPPTEVKPPMISTGSALSTTSDSENCTPTRAPQSKPATSATTPDTAHTRLHTRG